MTKILIIDDNPMAQHTISRILESAGYEVITAANGREGLAAFHLQQPDLVVSDIIMPEKEGIETIMEILRDKPGTKIIAISGGGRMGNTDLLQVAKKLGATETLAKPFDPQDLLDCVALCLKAA